MVILEGWVACKWCPGQSACVWASFYEANKKTALVVIYFVLLAITARVLLTTLFVSDYDSTLFHWIPPCYILMLFMMNLLTREEHFYCTNLSVSCSSEWSIIHVQNNLVFHPCHHCSSQNSFTHSHQMLKSKFAYLWILL